MLAYMLVSVVTTLQSFVVTELPSHANQTLANAKCIKMRITRQLLPTCYWFCSYNPFVIAVIYETWVGTGEHKTRKPD